MSNIKNVMFDIWEMYRDGYSPAEIAHRLKVPMNWVIETIDMMEEMEYDSE